LLLIAPMKFQGALIVGLSLVASEASAQLMTPVRVGAETAVDAARPLGKLDCINNTVRIQVNYTGDTTFNDLQMWIGTDAMTCATATSRTSTIAATCWQIETSTIGGSRSSFADTNFQIPARYLIDPVGDGDCTSPGTLRGTVATNYLSLIVTTSAGQNMVGTALAIPYDLNPPDVPTNVTAVPGEGAVTVSWRATTTTASTTDDSGTSTATTTASTDLAGFYLLCNPPANAGDDAGADAGAAGGLDVPDLTFGDDAGTSSTCPAFSVSDAQLYETAFFNRYVRGARTSTSATSATADNLTNGVPYRCVVVAEDNAGNRSVSTSSQCVIPLPVTDFWERYRQSGGAAQPIGCGARPGARTGALLACISLVATAVALMGRRRRKP
jgi:hypothetical protein